MMPTVVLMPASPSRATQSIGLSGPVIFVCGFQVGTTKKLEVRSGVRRSRTGFEYLKRVRSMKDRNASLPSRG